MSYFRKILSALIKQVRVSLRLNTLCSDIKKICISDYQKRSAFQIQYRYNRKQEYQGNILFRKLSFCFQQTDSTDRSQKLFKIWIVHFFYVSVSTCEYFHVWIPLKCDYVDFDYPPSSCSCLICVISDMQKSLSRKFSAKWLHCYIW